MTYGEKRKTLIFRLDNPNERAIYEQIVSRPNFSKYIKQLLFAELQRMRAQAPQQATVTPTDQK